MNPDPTHRRCESLAEASRPAARAFTLMEMMVVIAIIALLAAISAPALKGLGQGNIRSAAVRQVMSDLALARQLAIRNRTVVYFALIPPARPEYRGETMFTTSYGLVNSYCDQLPDATARNQVRSRLLRSITNAFASQSASYVLIAKRSLGDQPGRGRERYLTEWKTLPDGTLFPPALFRERRFNGWTNVWWQDANRTTLTFPIMLPELSGGGGPPRADLPAIGFNANGQIELDPSVRSRLGLAQGIPLPDVFLTIAEGSVFPPKFADGRYNLNGEPDIAETPKLNYTNNIIRISPLTGRARLDRAVILP